MKKLLKILGIALVVFFLIGIIGSIGKYPGNKPKEKTEKTQQITEQKPPEEQFTKEDALKKMQEYRITIDLKSPDISKGTTILEAYEIKGKVPAVKNLGWFTEETGEEGKYIAGYKQTVSEDLPQEPRWEVTKDSIKALNGKAVTITPEFGPKE